MNEDEILTASDDASSPALRAQEKTVEWFVAEIRARIADREAACEEMRDADVLEREDWNSIFALGAEAAFLRGLLVRSGHELNEPRGLSAADEPCSEGVTPNPPEVS